MHVIAAHGVLVFFLGLVRTATGYEGEQRLHAKIVRNKLAVPCKLRRVQVPVTYEKADGDHPAVIGFGGVANSGPT